MVAVYAAIVLLFSLPFMQHALARWTADFLTEQLHSKVEIGSINLGFLNRVIVNDMKVYEPNGAQMATVARVSASINLFSLLEGQVDIGTAQLFGTTATLYKNTPDSPPNFQFIIDAFTPEEEHEPTKLNIHIGSFIMRHAHITYDVKSEPNRPGLLDMNHLKLHDCGMNVVLNCLTDDSLNVSIRRLQVKESLSGLTLRDTQLKLEANHNCATLTNVRLSLPHSTLSLDSLTAEYGHFNTDSTFQFRSTPLTGTLTPSDLASLNEKLKTLNMRIPIRMKAEGNHQHIQLNECSIGDEESGLLLQVDGYINHLLKRDQLSLYADISTLQVENETLHQLYEAFVPSQPETERLVNAVGRISYHGTVNYAALGNTVSQGELTTNAGNVIYDMTYDSEHFLTGTITTDSIHLGKLTGNEQLGTTAFELDVAVNLKDTKPYPVGRVEGEIHNIYYKGYNYQHIKLDARSTSTQVEGSFSINDEHVRMESDFMYADTSTKILKLDMLLENFNPHALNLISGYEGDVWAMKVFADLYGPDLEHLYGEAQLKDINYTTSTDAYHLDGIRLNAQQLSDGQNRYEVKSDILTGAIEGKTHLFDIANAVTQQLSRHLPALVKPTHAEPSQFTYDFTINDAPILHHFIDADYSLTQPLHLTGQLNTVAQQMTLQMNASNFIFNRESYNHLTVNCLSTVDKMNIHTTTSTYKESDNEDEPSSSTRLEVEANILDNRIESDIHLDATGRNNIALQLLPTIQFSDSLGSLKTNITLQRSHAIINDTTWTVSPASISLFKKEIECRNVRFANNTNSFLLVNGRASSASTDSLVATLNDLEVKYILGLTSFSVVRFAGKASGKVVMNHVMGSGMPDMKANLHVKDLSIQEGMLGEANITAHWDHEVEGVRMAGRIVDYYKVPDALTGQEKNITGITTVDGWVSPARKDMKIDVGTHNTNAAFLHGFLRGIFKNISGCVSGPVSIIGPFNNVNIIADAVPNLNLQLRATGVPYHIEGDTIRMRPYLFDFQDISIYDRFGHRSVLNGQVTHRNMKNFAYHFQTELHELLAYDEKEFNSDKFMATVFADGNLTIDGSDGHPLYVNASVTPTRGSVFAYDAATPDAITGNSFIEFRDRDSVQTFSPHIFTRHIEDDDSQSTTQMDSLSIVKEAKKNYRSDIFINFDINLTPACEVKLRMDNVEDGYMRTFGHAQLRAQWYNKGSFQMFGNYNIDAGSYRLYLQDIIFRDLALQPGSVVEFNGNPFDADIHLICHHTIPSVPLSDLTATTAFSKNNKVRVICILDITGKLGNMDFKFDMDIPNVNEEVRQLVRSMINSEEEMNTQMIYLLGVGRFYPNEYARANRGDNSGQAMNSLLSSTLSGQINQMIGNMTGGISNWNFGSSVTTGEKGWNDLDVEGILEGKLLDERLLINGAFGYRDNAMTNTSSFIGDFEVKWRMDNKGNLYLKAYNQTNDRYFTKGTLNTQGIGMSWSRDFESIRKRLREKETKDQKEHKNKKKEKHKK